MLYDILIMFGNGLAVWLVKPSITAIHEIQISIGFINYNRLLAFRFCALASKNLKIWNTQMKN